MQRVERLKEADFTALRDFYWELIDKMQGSQFLPGWEKGVYPADEFLRDELAAGDYYALRVDGKLAAAMALNHSANDGYIGTNWAVEAGEGEFSVIHALGVMPDYHGQGLAKNLVVEAERLARESGEKALRLDVLDGNLPALRLYEGLGFEFRRKVRMFYEDTGWTDFLLYELVL